MQTEAAEAFDVRKRAARRRSRLYGPGSTRAQLPDRRRLVERGVRFVQVCHGDGQPWDDHDDIDVKHRKLAQRVRPADRRACSTT